MKPKTLTVYRVEVRDGVPTLEPYVCNQVGKLWDEPFAPGYVRWNKPDPELSDPDKVIAKWRAWHLELASVHDNEAKRSKEHAAEHRKLARTKVDR